MWVLCIFSRNAAEDQLSRIIYTDHPRVSDSFALSHMYILILLYKTWTWPCGFVASCRLYQKDRYEYTGLKTITTATTAQAIVATAVEGKSIPAAEEIWRTRTPLRVWPQVTCLFDITNVLVLKAPDHSKKAILLHQVRLLYDLTP